MAVATAPQLLTYEEYLAEGEVMKRYDIVDGVRIVANPTRLHNTIVGALYRAFYEFSLRTGASQNLLPPCDVLIRRRPLRVRQSDMILTSKERLARCPPSNNPAPLPVGPELVVEVLSPSDTRAVRTGKLDDFCAAGVDECWVIAPGPRTVEVLRLSTSGMESMALYGEGQEVASLIFPGLWVPVTAIFADI